MAIAKIGATVPGGNPTGAADAPFTVTSYTNGVLVARFVMSAGVSGSIVSVEFDDGVNPPEAFTRLGTGAVEVGSHSRAEIWYLLAPPVAAGTVVVTHSASGSGHTFVDLWEGVDQSTPWGTPAANANTAQTSGSVVVSSATGEVVLGVVGCYSGGTSVITSNDVEDGAEEIGGNLTSNASHQDGAASVTMDWTFSESTGWWAYGAALKPAGAPDPPTVTDVDPDTFADTDTGIDITGTNFQASQGSGRVVISPSDDIDDADAEDQTVTSWGDTAITVTAVQGAVPNGAAFLFVENDDGDSNASGFAVTFSGGVGGFVPRRAALAGGMAPMSGGFQV